MKKGVIISEVKAHNNSEQSWDSKAAIKRVKVWATEISDDNVFFNLERYAKAFFWLDADNGNISDFKLPYADIIDGELCAVWAGVESAMKATLDKETELPKESRKELYETIAKYYAVFGKEAPEFNSEAAEEPNDDKEDDAPDDGQEEQGQGEEKKRFVSATITEKDSGDNSFTAVASTASEDRHGEVIDVSGWNLKNFKKNPVLLWAHDHTIPAIGKVKRIWISNGRLMFKGIWQEATEMGRAAKSLVEGGFINSFSVGFLPYEMDGNTYTKQELLEISLVNVPANPDAMMMAYKSLKEAGIKQEVMKDLGMPVEVLDKLELLDKDVANLTEKVESLVKAQTSSAAPTAHSTTTSRAKQSLTKVIIKASDQLLAGEKKDVGKQERVKLIKVVKRAADILSAAHKEQIKNG